MNTGPVREMVGRASGTASKRLLAACALVTVAVVPAPADTELPGIVVTAPANRVPPDVVSRDRARRSPDIHWPSVLSLEWSEMFAHNDIEIDAPCSTVWNHLVQAERWPQWLPNTGTVKILDGSHILQKNTRFRWSGLDLPLDSMVFDEYLPGPVDSKVSEYVPNSRLGWLSYGARTLHGPLCETYHTWLLTPTGARKCRVIFEEVATGVAARYARGACPEITHLNHQRWLQGLKAISEARNPNGF